MTMTDNLMPAQSVQFDNPVQLHDEPQPCSLRREVERSLEVYFEQLGNDSMTGLYDLVLSEVEAPLLEAVMRHTSSNQSKASIMLGMNRGTLRKKLKQYGLL